MANAIETALKEIYIQIPREILELAFMPRQRMITLDKCIQDDVITPKVLYDCNIVGGRQATIVLKPDWVIESQLPDNYNMYSGTTYCIYRIPPEAREYRPIVDCISCSYPGYLYGYGTGYGSIPNLGMSGVGVSMGDVACQTLSAMNGTGVASPTPIRLSGHEVKLTPITMGYSQNVDWILTCRLAYDKEFTNLNTRALRTLAQLTVLAVKSFIYTKLIVQIDAQYLEGGQEMGIVKDIVSSYSDTYQQYQETLLKFHGRSVHADPELSYRRIWNWF